MLVGWQRGAARKVAGVLIGAALVVSSACAGGADKAEPGTGTSSAPDRVVDPGCDVARPAVAFRFGGARIEPPPEPRPVPCARDLGAASESAMVGVTTKGEIAAAPLLAADRTEGPARLEGPALVAVSEDRGGTWRTSPAGEPAHGLLVPPWLSADPHTSRIWFASVLPSLCGSELSWSDDGGRRWETNPLVGCPGMGSLRVIEGPAPPGGAAPSGYEHVVYVCANATDLALSTVHCFRSLDGGRSFAPVGGFPDPPVPPGCATRHPARAGTVGADGALVFPVVLCGEISVAVSRDEGGTWQWHHVHTGDVQELHLTSAAADDAGNLYLAWLAGPPPGDDGVVPGASPFGADAIQGTGTPVLAISRDGGATWTEPRPIAPPDVAGAQRIAISARAAGQVAVSFLATTDAGATFNGYIVASDDVLASEPVLWSAAVNDPARPLSAGPLQGTHGDRLFYLNNAFGPDGTPWAAFHCVATPGCSSPRSAVIGHLAR
jgi:hypothetical protein